MEKLTVFNLAQHFGASIKEFDDSFYALYDTMNFEYRTLTPAEKEKALLYVLQQIDSDTQIIDTDARLPSWESGWQENFNEFCKTLSIGAIYPKYYRKNSILRLSNEFVISENASFEYNYLEMFRHWLFTKYLKGINNLYEFGCGSGVNSVHAVQMFPELNVFATDYASSSVALMEQIGYVKYPKLKAFQFDMTRPNYEIPISEKSCALTVGSIEQINSNFEPMIRFLLDKEFDLCIHVEPIPEIYDANNIMDYTANKFHKKRGYTSGLLPYLQVLEQKKLITIEKIHRQHFGNTFFEGWTYVIWKPIKV